MRDWRLKEENPLGWRGDVSEVTNKVGLAKLGRRYKSIEARRGGKHGGARALGCKLRRGKVGHVGR